MLGRRSTQARRRALLVSVITASGLGVALLTAPAAQALTAPGGLSEVDRNTNTHVLSWSAVRKATGYEVQLDASGAFDSPDFSATTVNTRIVPDKALPSGTEYWRVRSVSGSTRSAWTQGSFTIAPVAAPVPQSPADGVHLAQPQQPPLLQWSAVQGATSYTVLVDSEPDMIGAKSYTTKGTSLVVPDPLTVGDWFWQVTASKGNGLNSLPSATSSFWVDPLPAPTITYPADNIVTSQVEDVVLDWTPVAGATTYDLQVSTDQDFNNIALSVTNIRSTRYSPATTLNSDQFWWRVRAVDPAGQPTPWTSTLYGFQRVWPERATPLYPLGADLSSPAAISGTKAFYQWTPVKHATRYQLQVSTDVNFSPAVTKTCTTAQTTYTPRSSGDCGFPSGSTVLYWHVRPLDLPYPSGGLPGLFSDEQAFTYTPPAPPAGSWDPSAQVTGLKIGIDGLGATSGTGCTGTAPDDVCSGLPTTPVLSWDPVPGATFYYVYYAQDGNFTTTEIPSVPVTSNTIFQLNTSNSLSALPDSQAGTAYYWHVVPCLDNSHCGPSPVSSATVLPDTRSFRKASPAVTGLTSSNPNSSEITFSWDDYYDTNRATTWNGEMSNQTAKNYKIEVDNNSNFASPIDTAVVDQATYTEWSKLYPDGTYYWRVQALDDESQGQTWSAPQTFIKVSPSVSLTSPVGGAHVAGTTPFRWAAAPFAASYNLEVYKNDDLAFSPANRVVSQTVKTTAYVPSSPLPASSSAYVWRVRRVDASGNPGPWSTTGSFFSNGSVPGFVRPASGVWVPATRGLFEWTEVPGATSYQLKFGGASTASFTTPATAYAPTGKLGDGSYTWKVTAFDSGGHELGTSATRTFRVDGTPPKVTKISPTTLKPTSVIKATFSERVRGVSGSSMKLYRLKGKKRIHIKAKVTVLKKGKMAALDPSSRLKPGSYLVLFIASKIRDRAGNTLVPSSVAQPLARASLAGTGVEFRYDLPRSAVE